MTSPSINPHNLPKHIAVIMDGNRRWAKRKGLAALQGHRKGIETVKTLLNNVLAHNIPYITLFSFSSENWKRSEKEVSGLMDLLKLFLKAELKTFHEKGIKLRFIGSRKNIAADIIDLFNQVEQETKNYNKLNLTIAFNYGSRAEITEAAKKLAIDVGQNKLNIDDITEDVFANYLYTYDLPEPDLLLRTSGELRISNFLLWQLAYTEMIFVETPWPEFSKEDFNNVLKDYQNRIRRFGGD